MSVFLIKYLWKCAHGEWEGENGSAWPIPDKICRVFTIKCWRLNVNVNFNFIPYSVYRDHLNPFMGLNNNINEKKKCLLICL